MSLAFPFFYDYYTTFLSLMQDSDHEFREEKPGSVTVHWQASEQ